MKVRESQIKQDGVIRYDVLEESTAEDASGAFIKVFNIVQTVTRNEVVREIEQLNRELSIIQGRLDREEVILRKIDRRA